MRLPWAVLLLTLLGGRYLAWRLGSTLNLEGPLAAGLSLAMLLAELALLATAFLQLWFTLAPDPGIAALTERAALDLAQRRRDDPRALPAVDVLVPSYGEPPELIARCLRGCLALDYPRLSVWLLDDSGRPELERLCAGLGCRYLARERRDHAKAGNLNHALPHLRGDLIAVFDADVVPQTSFLARTVGLFADGAVGFVQTPQSYMNADPVIRNLRLERWLMPDEETFYRWVEPVRQGLNAVVCAGTSFVMRRSALLQVGGFETGTPSEDLATGIRLAAAGYRNLFVAEKLSAGLAPFTLAAMARQRCRWASGTLQTLRTGASPFSIAGLRPLQRLAFLEGILHWCNVLPQLLLVLMPLSIGVLGVAPLRVNGAGLLLYALPFYGAQLLLARWFSGQARTALLPELYRWVFLVPLAAAVLGTLLGRPHRFRVTPKAPTAGRQLGAERRLLLPLLALLSLQGVGLLNLMPWGGLALAPISTATMALGLVWAGFNGLLLLLAIRTCWDRGGGDGTPWFAVEAPGLLQGLGNGRSLPVRLRAISAAGVELEWPAASALDPAAALPPGLTLALPGHATPLPLRLEAQEGRRLGALWGDLSAGQRDRLEHQLYRRSGLWPQRRAPFEPLALAAVLRRLLQPVPPEGWFGRSLLPQAQPALAAPPPEPLRPPGSRPAAAATAP